MAKTLQFRRGTTSELSSQTGAEGEIFIDTTKDTVVVMDGNTPGGFPLATEASVTGDVVFDSALIGDVSITGNTIAGVDSYGNGDTLIVDGNLDVQGTFTVNGEPVSGGGGAVDLSDYQSGNDDIRLNSNATIAILSDGITGIDANGTILKLYANNKYIEWNSDDLKLPANTDIVRDDGTGNFVSVLGGGAGSADQNLNTTDDVVFNTALLGDVSIISNTISGIDAYGNADTLNVTSDLNVVISSVSTQTYALTYGAFYDFSEFGMGIGLTVYSADTEAYNDSESVSSGDEITVSFYYPAYSRTITGKIIVGNNQFDSNTGTRLISSTTITYLNGSGDGIGNTYSVNTDQSTATNFTLTLSSEVDATPLSVTASGVNVDGTFTVNGEPVGGSGSSFDQDLNTTDDVVFNSALVGDVSIVDNTISATDSYGNPDTLTVDGILTVTNVLPDISTTYELVEEQPGVYPETVFLGGDNSTLRIFGVSEPLQSKLLSLPVGTEFTVTSNQYGTFTILLSTSLVYNPNLPGLEGGITNDPSSGGGMTITSFTYTITTAGDIVTPLSVTASGVNVDGTFTVNGEPVGGSGSSYDQDLNITDDVVFNSALIGDVSIVGNQISGIDSYGNGDTLVVDGDLEVTGSLINDSTLTVNQDGSKSVVVDTTASTTTTLDMSGYGTLQWSLNNNDGRYYFFIPTSLYELYSEYFIAGTVVTGFFDSAGKAGPFTLTLDTNMASMQLSASSGYGAKTVGNPPGFPPNSTNNIWPNEVTVTNSSGSITDYSFDDQGTFSTTSLLADSALIGDVSIAGNTIAAVDSYGTAADLAISAASVTFDQDLTLSVDTSVAVVESVFGGMNQFYVYGPMNGNVFSYNSMGSTWSDSSKFVTGSIVSVTDNMDGNVVVRLTSNMTYSMGAGGFIASYTVVSGGTNLNMGASYNASTVTVTNTTGSIADYSFDDQGTLTTTALLSDSALIGDVSIAGNTISAIDSYGINSPLTIDHGLTVTGLSTTGNIYTLVPDVDFDSNTRWTSSAGYGTFTIDFTNVNGGVATANLLAFINQISSGTVITIPNVGDRVVGNPPTLNSTTYYFTTVVDPFAQIYITGNIVLDQTVTSTIDVITVTDSGLNVNGTSTTTSLLADSALVGDVSIIGSTISGVDSYGLSDTLVVDGDLEVTGGLDIRSVSPSITNYFYVLSDGPIAWLGTFLTVDNPNPDILTLIQSLNVGDKLTFQDQMNVGTSVTVTLTSTMSFNGMSYIATVAENNSSGMSISPANGTLTVTSLITNTSSFDSTGINVSNVNAQLLTTESLTTTSLLADSALIGDVSIVGSTIAGVDSYGVADTLTVDGDLQITGNLTLPTNATAPSNTSTVVSWAKIVVGSGVGGTSTYTSDGGSYSSGGAIITQIEVNKLIIQPDNWTASTTTILALPSGTVMDVVYLGSTSYELTLTSGFTFNAGQSWFEATYTSLTPTPENPLDGYVTSISFTTVGAQTYYMPLYQ